MMNVGSRPGNVGKKKGAFSGTFGASLGLLRFYHGDEVISSDGHLHTLIVSKFNKFCHLDFGSSESVIISAASCSGD